MLKNIAMRRCLKRKEVKKSSSNRFLPIRKKDFCCKLLLTYMAPFLDSPVLTGAGGLDTPYLELLFLERCSIVATP